MNLSPNSTVYRIVQWSFFPLAVVGLPWLVHVLIQAGLHFAVATYSGITFIAIVFLVLEHVMPYRPHWNKLAGDLGNDILSGSVAYLLLPKLFTPLYFAALAGAAAWLAVQFGGDIWPSHWPLWTQVVLLMLAGDAGRYWGHRLAHQVPLLWRFHAIHHSATRLWFLNATRQHPVDKLWFMASELLLPILLGVNGEVLSLYLAVTAVCGFTQHCNIDLKLGYLYWIFNVADLHRWHHSKNANESDNNYGNNLIVYDRLFGTCFHPEARGETRQVGDIGLLNPDYPKSYWGQLRAPFARRAIDKEGAAGLEAPERNESLP